MSGSRSHTGTKSPQREDRTIHQGRPRCRPTGTGRSGFPPGVQGAINIVTELFRQYHLRLLNLASRIVGDRSDAEDVLQEAFLIIQNKIATFRGESEVYTWMYRIVVNLALKRKSTLTKERIRRATVEMTEWKAQRPDPEGQYLSKELLETVQKECHFVLLGLLTGEQRAVYLMRTQDQLSFAEIGRILRIRENAAKARMHRAVAIIEKDLRSRCSRCSPTGSCTCEDCAQYILHKNPELMEKMRSKETDA